MNENRVEGVSRHGPFPGMLDPERIAAYAAATGDQTAAALTGDAVPPVFPVILAFDAQDAANADLPLAVWQQAAGGVHGEHDVVLHRPLVPNESLDTWSRLSGVHRTRARTTVLFGVHGLEDTGSVPGDHRFPETARESPLGSATHVEGEIARRYAEVSGDWSARHFDLDAARASGFDFLFAQGNVTCIPATRPRHATDPQAPRDAPNRDRDE